MSDATLRELERRFRASGDVADEAALLRARLRAGALTEDKLYLAAYAGSASALEAAPGELPTGAIPQALGGWVGLLEGCLGYPSELASTATRLTARLCAEWVVGLGRHHAENAELFERAVGILGACWEFPVASEGEVLRRLIPAPPPAPFPDPFGGPVFPGGVGLWHDDDPAREVLQDAYFACFRAGRAGRFGALRAAGAAEAAFPPADLLAALQRGVREWALTGRHPDPEVLRP